MAGKRKLGYATDRRIAVLRGLTTSLLLNGKLETTFDRAKEVQKIAEKLIGKAVKEADNFTTKQVKVSKAKLDSTGKKITVETTSKNGNKYSKVERETVTEMKQVDGPSRLAARKQAIKFIYRVSDEKGNSINVVNKLYDEIAPKYKDRNGGYTRIYKLGVRRGDAAEKAILELV